MFFRPPPDTPSLPAAVPFGEAASFGVPVSDEVFSSNTGDLSPEVLSGLVERHGSEVVFSRFGKLTFLFTSPDLVEEILVRKASSFLMGEEARAISAVVGWGLFVQEGHSHRSMQKALNPGLRGEILDSYLARIVPLFAESLKAAQAAQPRLVEFTRMVSQSAAELSLFGTNEPTNDFRYKAALFIANKFSMSDVASGRTSVRAATAKFVEAKSILDSHVENLTQSWALSDRDNLSLMDYVNGATDRLDDPERRTRDQAGLFLQAATETTASLLSWMLIHFSGRDDIWARLREEIRETNGAPVSHTLLKSLEFHQAVVNESLRITPPVWFLPRVAAEDCVIGGFPLPRGSRIILSPWVAQRSEDSFDEPLVFSPERWLKSKPGSIRGGFYPFGLGGRVCIGEAYSRMAAVAMLYSLAASEKTLSVNQPVLDIGLSYLVAIPRIDLTLTVA